MLECWRVVRKTGREPFVIYKARHRKFTNSARRKKRERTKFFLQERSWPLDPPANERPFSLPKKTITKAVLQPMTECQPPETLEGFCSAIRRIRTQGFESLGSVCLASESSSAVVRL